MRYFVCFIALLATCWGCKEDPSVTPPPAPTLTVSAQSVTLEAGKNLQTSVTIETNQDKWTASCPAVNTWCHLQPQGKTLVITVDPNTTTKIRSTIVTVTVGTGPQRLERTVAITQQASEESSEPAPEEPDDPDKPEAEITLALGSESITLPIAGGTSGFITVTSSTAWSATLPAQDTWCSLSITQPVGFTLTAQENTTGTDRSTTVTITATDGTASVTKTLVVTQAKNGDVTAAFTDPYFRAFVLRNYDKNKDNLIQSSELENITHLSITNNYIVDLAGIECFINLTQLTCSYDRNLTTRNSIKYLDVSKNFNLTSLSIEGTAITSLDLSKNLQLEFLSARYNDDLPAIDISHNTKLIYVSIQGIKFTGLDVSQNKALQHLSIDDSQISALDVTHNPELTTLYIQNPLEGTSFSTLDISKNSELTVLICSGTSLSSLDLTYCPKLTRIACNENNLTSLNVTNLTELEYLNCMQNNLSTLDVTSNPKLKQLECSNNKLTALNLVNKPLLQDLKCAFNDIQPSIDISKTAIEILDCRGNKKLTTIYVKPGFIAPSAFRKDPTANYVVKN